MIIHKGENMYTNKKNTIDSDMLSASDIIFPEKYIKLSLIFYTILIPFIIGHIFLYTYIADFNLETYNAICNQNNSFLTWCMGYESFAIVVILAIILLLSINILSRIKLRK